MAILFVQQKEADSNFAATVVATFDTAVTPGNIVIVSAGIHSGPNQTMSITGLTGATWESRIDIGGVGHKAIWVGSGFSGGAAITLTPSSGTPRMGLKIMEFSGLTVTSDGTNSATGFSTAPATGGVTTAFDGGALIVAMFGEGPTPVISGDPPTGWTAASPQLHANGNINLYTDYRIETSPGTFSAAWTADASDDWFACIAAFQATAAAPPAGPTVAWDLGAYAMPVFIRR